MTSATRIKTLLVSSLLGICLAFPAAANNERPKIGLALAGGGAKGSIHLAVLEELEKNHIPVDFITGTSIGAYVGGLYAMGYNAEQVKTIMLSTDFTAGYSDAIPREELSYRKKQFHDKFNIPLDLGYSDGQLKIPGGILDGQTMSKLYRNSVGNLPNLKSFDDLAIPFRAVATDLETSKAVVLDNGDLVTAMLASASVPGALTPQLIDGKLLVDGGLANNMPVDLLREMGADIIIAVDISNPLMTKQQLGSTLNTLRQITAFLTFKSIEEQKNQLGKIDIYIQPDLEGLSTTDFSLLEKGYASGKEVMQNIGPELQKIPVSQQQFSNYQTKKQQRHQQIQKLIAAEVDSVVLENNSTTSDDFILDVFSFHSGPISARQINNRVDDVYSLDFFQRVNTYFIQEGESKTLHLRTQEKSWGPNYIEAGLGWEDDFDLNSVVDLDLAFTLGNINDNGGEWRNELGLGTEKSFRSELYLPLSQNQRFFSRNQYLYERYDWDYFVNDTPVFVLEQYLHQAETAFGIRSRRSTSFELGLTFQTGQIDNEIVLLETLDYDFGGAYLRLGYDTLNSISFPTEGNRLTLEVSRVREDIDGLISQTGITTVTDEFYSNRYLLEWKGAIGISNHALVGKMSYEAVDADSPDSIRFSRLGGFLNLSGFHRNALTGNKKTFAAVIYQYDLGRSALGLERFPLYLGISLESGNVWAADQEVNSNEMINAGSVYLGTDTKLGPIVLGYGQTEEEDSAVYFYLGKSF